MMSRAFRYVLPVAVILLVHTACAGNDARWTREFGVSSCKLATTGKNPYFVLEPGYQLVLEGKGEKVQITVLDETKNVGGVDTRVVEEREWKNGTLREVSRNYFAICEQTGDVFYFGEDVDNYDDSGKVVNHDGTWLAGTGENKPGLMMPGTPKVGMRYYLEIAPGVAMDRAEIVSLDETCKTPAGTFSACMKVRESTALGSAKEYKYHAPGIGLVRDEDFVLTSRGVVTGRR